MNSFSSFRTFIAPTFFFGAFLVVFGLFIPLKAQAAKIAVLAVDAANANDKKILLKVAEATRAHIAAQGGSVLSAQETQKRMRLTDMHTIISLQKIKKRLTAAESAYRALNFERAIELLESITQDLATDADLSKEKILLLEQTRLKLVKRLLSLAGTSESGAATTKLGKRARQHLMNALRNNPQLELDATKFSPKIRQLLASSKKMLRNRGNGSLTVTSEPLGATVFLEGLVIGKTPLRLEKSIPFGRYRLWVSINDAHSIPRWINITATESNTAVDLAFEGALWAQGPGLTPVKGRVINEKIAAKVGALLKVEEVILVGTAQYDEALWLYGAVFSSVDGTSSRRGAVRIANNNSPPTPKEVAELSRFLLRSGGDSLAEAPVPQTVLPKKQTLNAQNSSPPLKEYPAERSPLKTTEESESAPILLYTTIAVGTGVALATGAGIAAALAFSLAPTTASLSFDLEVIE